MAQPTPAALIFHVDQEHDKLRFVLPLIMLASLVVSYILAGRLVNVIFGADSQPDGAILLICGITLPLGLLLTFLAERGLKSLWRSGRMIQVEGSRLRLVRPEGESAVVNVSAPFLSVKWIFLLSGYPRGGRERHISPKWFCVAYKLQQDGKEMIFFSFLPPRQADQLAKEHAFTRIIPGDVYESSFARRTFGVPERPNIPARIITGKHGRAWLAERERWQEGVELTRPDFHKLMTILEPQTTSETA